MHPPISDFSPDIGGNPIVATFGMLSTFPPTPCGIATFAAALSAGLIAQGATVDVVRCGATQALEDSLVVASLGDGSSARLDMCIEALNATDVVIVQHEYGIYDGVDGDAVLDLMAGLVVPVMLIAHTVVSDPTASQRSVLERACGLADVVVVMTITARDRLLAGFSVDADKVTVIPHGAATPPASTRECEPSIEDADEDGASTPRDC